MKKRCNRYHLFHQCKTDLCKACRGPKIYFDQFIDCYMSEIAELDPDYFD